MLTRLLNPLNLFHFVRLEISQNRLARWINSNSFYKMIRPGAWEPEVLDCLCNGKWDGPVWDVGACFGRHTFRIAEHHSVYAFEPNLNSLQFLAYNLRLCPNAVIVPCALTADGKPMKGTYHADFMAPNTGPQVATLSLDEALRKFGRPGVIKLDVEGGEYDLLKSDHLIGLTLLIEWHREIPTQLEHWDIKTIDPTHSLLTPRKP
jgi:FkbM family methyltransferase